MEGVSKRPLKRLFYAGLFLLAFCGVAAALSTSVTAPWYSVLPPLVAMLMTLVFNRIIPSLLSAVIFGGWLATIRTSPVDGIQWFYGLFRGINYLFQNATNLRNLELVFFVAATMMMVSVIIVSGGMHGVVRLLSRFAKGARSAQVASFLMSLSVFIDHYANALIVGPTIRPLTDRHRVSREKLAFIVDATSTTVAGVAIISTWISYEVGLFGKVSEGLKLGRDGYSLFFDTLPFRFYCFMMLAFIAINLITGREFGPMLHSERRSRRHGKHLRDGAKLLSNRAFNRMQADSHSNQSVWMAVIPVAMFFVILGAGLWMSRVGSVQAYEEILKVATWREILSASENKIALLTLSAVIAWIVAFFLARVIGGVRWLTIRKASGAGIRGSLRPIAILLLAWSLKSVCEDLDTGIFLAATVGRLVSPEFFPALLFVLSAATAFSIGTSWGTMAILIPTTLPVALQMDGNTYGPITIICLGAVLDGSVFGDHCSPISDTTIMSSLACSCDHIDHMRTQVPYALYVGIGALMLGYLPAAVGIPPAISLLFFTLLTFGLMRTVAKKIETPVA